MSELHDAPPEPQPVEELFADFANEVRLTPAAGPELDREIELLRAWLVGRDLVASAPARSRLAAELPEFRELRSLIRALAARTDVGKAPSRSQVGALNRVLREGVHYHALQQDAGTARFSMRPVGDDLRQARGAIAGSLAHYLADHDPSRLRVCASETCRWVFVDRSPGGRRRWCEMRTCGNRAKVARHRARRAAARA
jgi:predicted RNA-binding Zn ribbon-like protein